LDFFSFCKSPSIDIVLEENDRYEAGPARHTITAPFFLKKKVQLENGRKIELKKGEENRKPSKMVALTSLSPGPPRPSPSPATPRRRPPAPKPHVYASSRRRGRILRAATAAAATPGADDYHSTIRSLNSRGRHVPRKSLGQVLPLTSRFAPLEPPPTDKLTIHRVPTRLSSPRRTTCSTPR